MGKTKDELLVLRIYEVALQSGDVYAVVNRYEIGRLTGLAPKAVDTICTLLAQANFIKKQGKIDISLTPHGEKLALRLLGE